jgi:N-acetylmuramoyl-L-alanine amidase
MKIFIDPGHGGSSIGATYKGRVEQDDCLRLALKVRDLLLQQKNVEVKMSRTGDTNPDLKDRAAEANAWGADYFISIHRNALAPNKASGVEIWIYSGCATGGETYNIAKKICDNICTATGFKNRGIKKGAPSYKDFAVNRLTKMSSCLAEVGFIDNDSDNAIFDKKFNEMALSIAKSIYEANGGKWAEIGTKTEEKTPAKNDGYIYTVQVGAFSDKKNAEAYAEKVKKAGFDAFVTVKGDYDGDGRITAKDAQNVLNKSVGK